MQHFFIYFFGINKLKFVLNKANRRQYTHCRPSKSVPASPILLLLRLSNDDNDDRSDVAVVRDDDDDAVAVAVVRNDGDDDGDRR